VLTYIEEFKTNAAIAGFRNVRIKNLRQFLEKISRDKPADVEAQFFDATFIATWQHLYFAVLNALSAFRNKKSISKSLAMEIMLYASAQGQIHKATESIGISSKSIEVVAVIVGKRQKDVNLALSIIAEQIDAEQDDTVLEFSKEKVNTIQKIFGISETEAKTVMKGSNFENALVDLVIERMALLATRH
jgi:tRNA threonylcarbamoyladenosine modification (KEOPS) complex Cgi121 subunit